MLTLSAAYLSHLAGTVLELATCWKITRRDGQVFGFTDHVENITVAGQLYESAVGYSATDIESSAGLSVDNLNVQGIIDAASITEPDLMAGLWDGARVELFEVVYSDLTAGTRPLRAGTIGEVTMGRVGFEAELRALSQALSQEMLELTSPTCRVDLGSTRCGVDLTGFTVTGTVTSASSARVFSDTGRTEADDYFAFGVVEWTSGANDGLSMEIKSSTSAGAVSLVLPMPYAIAAGDTYSMVAGCDKLFATCGGKFANVVNFQGEPHIPGQDFMYRGPRR
jgi:uncharacterized phage protein (TIGR02218 family)